MEKSELYYIMLKKLENKIVSTLWLQLGGRASMCGWLMCSIEEIKHHFPFFFDIHYSYQNVFVNLISK